MHFFEIYGFVILHYFCIVYFLVPKQHFIMNLFHVIYFASLLSVTINISLLPLIVNINWKNIPSEGVIHSIVSIIYNVILICALNVFKEPESLKLQVYFDICLIQLLNNKVKKKVWLSKEVISLVGFFITLPSVSLSYRLPYKSNKT